MTRTPKRRAAPTFIRVAIHLHHYRGHLAVHRAIEDLGGDYAWSVSHAPTGCRVARAKTLRDAEQICDCLARAYRWNKVTARSKFSKETIKRFRAIVLKFGGVSP